MNTPVKPPGKIELPAHQILTVGGKPTGTPRMATVRIALPPKPTSSTSLPVTGSATPTSTDPAAPQAPPPDPVIPADPSAPPDTAIPINNDDRRATEDHQGIETTSGGNPPDRTPPSDNDGDGGGNGDSSWKRNWWWIVLLIVIFLSLLGVIGFLLQKQYPNWKSIFAKSEDVRVQTVTPRITPEPVAAIAEPELNDLLRLESSTNSTKITTSTRTAKPLVRNEQRDVAGSINAPNNSGIQFNVLLNGEELKKLAEKPKTKIAMLGMPEKPDYEEYLVKEGTIPQVGVKLTVEKTVRPGNGTRFHFPKGFKPDAEIDLDRREFEFWMNIGTKDDPEWTVYKSDPSKPKPKCESYWVRIKTTTPAKIVFTLTPSPRKDP